MRLKNFFRFNGVKLTKNYSLDWNFFWKVRSFEDGIKFLTFDINLDLYESDHKPSFNIYLGILNYTIFEIEIYNVNHLLEEEEDDKREISVDVEKLAKELTYKDYTDENGEFIRSTIGADDYKNGIIRGYNQCLQDNNDNDIHT